jgi:hypothetical protein
MACKKESLKGKQGKKVQEKVTSLLLSILAKNAKYHHYRITTN